MRITAVENTEQITIGQAANIGKGLVSAGISAAGNNFWGCIGVRRNKRSPAQKRHEQEEREGKETVVPRRKMGTA